jgi:hypothetical protein
MPKPPKKSSAYAEYLYHMVDEYFLKRGGAFTIVELAEFCHLKVTTNMRRRIRHAVAAGKLAVSTAYVGEKRSAFVYYLPSDYKQGEFPF